MSDGFQANLLPTDNDRLLLEAHRATRRGDWANAAALADECLKNDPANNEALFIVATCLSKLGNKGAALQFFNLLTKVRPDLHAVWHNLGGCLLERHPKDAYRAFIKANELKADDEDTLASLANVASMIGRNAEAIEWADRALRLYGDAPEASHNKSFALFALGRWEEGWQHFRRSLGSDDRKTRNYHPNRETPRWNPDTDEGAVVVIYGEQGIGDEIMYASMINDAIQAAEAKGSRVIVECYERNADLFMSSFDCQVFGTLRQAYCDWPREEGVTHKLEMGGLGEFFGKEPFRRGAYLKADFARGQAAMAWLKSSGAEKAFKVGVAWTGGSWQTGRNRRSVPLDDILQLPQVRGATFVNLEYEDRREDLQYAPHVLNPHWATRKGADYGELAALVSNLDLVIAPTTSVVDLCGALGKECWVMADEHPQWRYSDHAGPDKMFFYESVKVYRQQKWGEWRPVVERIIKDLKERIA